MVSGRTEINPNPEPLPMEAETRSVLEGHVTEDLPCPRCGYNLHTLACASSCPECNLPVAAATAPHGFRLANVRRLRLVRYGAGCWAAATVFFRLAYLLLTLVCLSTVLWMHDRADVERYYQIHRLAATPLRISGILGPLLVAATAWLFISAGLRLRRFDQLLKAALIVYLFTALLQAGAAVVDQLTFRPGFVTPTSPLRLWSGISLSLLLTVGQLVPWAFLALCLEPRQAPRLRWLVMGCLVVSAAEAALGLAELIITLRFQLASAASGPFLVFPGPGRLESLYASVVHYTAPAFPLLQLVVIWVLVRRLHTAEAALRQRAAPPR